MSAPGRRFFLTISHGLMVRADGYADAQGLRAGRPAANRLLGAGLASLEHAKFLGRALTVEACDKVIGTCAS